MYLCPPLVSLSSFRPTSKWRKEVKRVAIFRLTYRWFHIKGTWSVYSFNGDYLSIPSAQVAVCTVFMKSPVLKLICTVLGFIEPLMILPIIIHTFLRFQWNRNLFLWPDWLTGLPPNALKYFNFHGSIEYIPTRARMWEKNQSKYLFMNVRLSYSSWNMNGHPFEALHSLAYPRRWN